MDFPPRGGLAETLRRQGIELAWAAVRAVAVCELVRPYPPFDHRHDRYSLLGQIPDIVRFAHDKP
jgi:hypothetical protein